MLTVRLHGHLEEKYGSEFKFQASTVREVIDALQANFDDFTEEFIKDERAYNILVDMEVQELNGCVLPIKTDSTIDIIPIIGGAGFLKALGLIVVGALLVAATGGLGGALLGQAIAGGSALATGFAGAVASVAGVVGFSTIAAIGWGLALAGVASLLAGPDGPDGGGSKSSSLSQTDNIIGQGMPIPIGYGRLMVGSVVISATFMSSYTQISNAWSYEDTLTGETKDKVIQANNASETDTANAAADGFIASGYGLVSGYGLEQAALINAAAEVALGNGTYELTNVTTVSGTIISVPVYVPTKREGTYDDTAINHLGG